MQIFILCIVYTIAVGILIAFAVKNFLKMKKSDNQLYRQYFFTALFLLGILIVSFIVILARLNPQILVESGDGSAGIIGYATESSYSFLISIFLIIIGIAAIVLFDRYVLKRRSKTEREYRIRRRLAIGGLILLIGIITVIRLLR